MSKVVLVAPFWNQPENVGLRRLQAMRRWLRAAGAEVVVVSATAQDGDVALEGGLEVGVRDPRQSFGSLRRTSASSLPLLGLWRLLNGLRDNPDPGVAWARAVARHPQVASQVQGARLVISSSPPESAHVAGQALARSTGAAHVMDLQDGWLDEPLKPVLQRVAWRRWQEGRLERRLLRDAAHILVTSPVWASRLAQRLPFTASRITTLYSAYPPPELQATGRPPVDPSGGLRLLHAGTFTLSHNARRIELLLAPLQQGLAAAGQRGQVQLLGALQPFEVEACRVATPAFTAAGWDLAVQPPVPREDYLRQLPTMHGLLLLSASMGALPSKLFEYLTTGRPILTLTRRGSAVWQLGQELSSLSCLDYDDPGGWVDGVRGFLEDCRDVEPRPVPPQFTEDALGQVFLAAIRPHLAAR